MRYDERMKKPWIIVIIVIIIVLAGLAFAASRTEAPTTGAIPSAASSSGAPAPAVTSSLSTPPAATGRELSWSFAAQPEDAATGMPRTRVTLARGAASYDLGTHDGTCFVVEDSAWTLQAGEVSGAICWFAGGGIELGVFEENGKLVVKKGDVDEGSAEGGGFRGNFAAVRTLD